MKRAYSQNIYTDENRLRRDLPMNFRRILTRRNKVSVLKKINCSMMKMSYLWLILLSFFLVRCDLEQFPESTTSKSAVFGSEQGLQLYANSFYSI